MKEKLSPISFYGRLPIIIKSTLKMQRRSRIDIEIEYITFFLLYRLFYKNFFFFFTLKFLQILIDHLLLF